MADDDLLPVIPPVSPLTRSVASDPLLDNAIFLFDTLTQSTHTEIGNFTKPDAIMMLGCYDFSLAETASKEARKAPYIPLIPCGKYNSFTARLLGKDSKGNFRREADVLTELLISKGVSPNRIYPDRESYNTRTNMENAHKILKQKWGTVKDKNIMIVTDPLVNHRVSNMFPKHFPETNCCVISSPRTFTEFRMIFASMVPALGTVEMAASYVVQIYEQTMREKDPAFAQAMDTAKNFDSFTYDTPGFDAYKYLAGKGCCVTALNTRKLIRKNGLKSLSTRFKFTRMMLGVARQLPFHSGSVYKQVRNEISSSRLPPHGLLPGAKTSPAP